MVVSMYKHMGKVMITILQGSAVTHTMLGGLTIHPPVASFLYGICAKNYENWLTVDKVIAKIIRLTFFWPTLYIYSSHMVLHTRILTTGNLSFIHTGWAKKSKPAYFLQ